MSSSARFRPLPLALGAALAVFGAVAVLSTRTAPDSYPVADTATTSIATLQAARGDLAVGSYSRFGWSHPGPLLYQILAGPYELSGRREIALKWTALALNIAWLGGLLAIVGRRAPGLAVAVALALVPLLWREQRLLFSAWNPFVAGRRFARWRAAAHAEQGATRRGRTTMRAPCREELAMLSESVHHAVRALRRDWRTTLLAAGLLAVTIGAVMAIFAIVDAVLLRPLPVPIRIGSSSSGSATTGGRCRSSRSPTARCWTGRSDRGRSRG